MKNEILIVQVKIRRKEFAWKRREEGTRVLLSYVLSQFLEIGESFVDFVGCAFWNGIEQFADFAIAHGRYQLIVYVANQGFRFLL